MKLNGFETVLMNNPIREWLQWHYEAPKMLTLAKAPFAPRTLVFGCGRGVDAQIAFEIFNSESVVAFDLDRRQVDRAKRRIGDRYGDRIELREADATAVPFPDADFDLVLDFGIIHHIPAWQVALNEAFRVLRPGGVFLFEEVPKKKLDTLRYRVLTDHPRENRFSADNFQKQCEESGFRIDSPLVEFFGFFRGAAIKPN